MCLGKVVVRCPLCKKAMQVTRPDSDHEYWSLDEPGEEEGLGSVIEEKLECRNSNCNSKFKIYWFEE